MEAQYFIIYTVSVDLVALFYVVHVLNGMRVFLFGQQFGRASQCGDFVGDNWLQACGDVVAVVAVQRNALVAFAMPVA